MLLDGPPAVEFVDHITLNGLKYGILRDPDNIDHVLVLGDYIHCPPNVGSAAPGRGGLVWHRIPKQRLEGTYKERMSMAENFGFLDGPDWLSFMRQWNAYVIPKVENESE